MSAFTLEPVTGTVVARADGNVIAETTGALMLREGSYDPVYYFPREDAGMEFLEASATRTRCPHKGEATHYDIELSAGTIADAAWSYEAPIDAATDLAGRIAFYADKVVVEHISG
ncbi:MAG: DUF427 domain-containing protein [Pseudomonadota bacterium]